MSVKHTALALLVLTASSIYALPYDHPEAAAYTCGPDDGCAGVDMAAPTIFVRVGRPDPPRRKDSKLPRLSDVRAAVKDEPDTPKAPLVLDAVHPYHHDTVRSIEANPRKFKGGIHWLLPKSKEGKPVFADGIPRFTLKRARSDDLRYLLLHKHDGKVYVVLYWRVSSDRQANKLSLKAQLRWMLRKCAAANLTIAALAIDVESGASERRPGLDEVEAAIEAGIVQVVVVPSIERLERDESHFANRMKKWSQQECVVLYGSRYDDFGFTLLNWLDTQSRRPAVDLVRAHEEYLIHKGGAIALSNLADLEDGLLISGKADVFALYHAEPLNPKKTKGKCRLRKAHGALTFYNSYFILVDAAEKQDRSVLDELVEREALRTGKAVTAQSLCWELKMGWAIGINRRSLNADTLVVECPHLAISQDREAHQILVQAIEELLDLGPGRRLKQDPQSYADDDVMKAKLAELGEARGDRIRLRWACDDGHPLVECKSAGAVTDGDPEFPQDFIFCPLCNGGVGNPGKMRLPRMDDIRRAQLNPCDPCNACQQWRHLDEVISFEFKGKKYALFLCAKCSKNLGFDGMAWSLPICRSPVQETDEEVKRRRAKQKGYGRKGRDPITGPPPGVDRILWTEPVPTGTTFYPDTGRATVAKRLEPLLVKHGATHCFTTTQLQSLGLGGDIEAVTDTDVRRRLRRNWGMAQWWLKQRLLYHRLDLVAEQYPKRHVYALYTQPISDEEIARRREAQSDEVPDEPDESREA